MKTPRIALAALLALSGALGAADLVNWSALEPGKSMGSFADEAGKAEAALADGPAKGQKALAFKADVSKWGGAWAGVQMKDLSQAGGLRFKAKADKTVRLMVSLNDGKKIQAQAAIQVKAGDWQEFTVPMASFKKSAWQPADAPKDGSFNPADVTGFSVSVGGAGKYSLGLGPVAVVTGAVVGQTGLQDGSGKDGALTVQDFEALENGAYGSFVDDKGGKVALAVVAGDAGKALQFQSELAEGGWGGAWLRAGEAWGGQDWSGAKRITLRVKSDAPVSVELAFNDANQNAYVAPAVNSAAGKGWQVLEVPFAGFQLNPYYQPPQAKKGAALDLGKIETFNINVKTMGKASFLVDDVVLYKK